MTDRDKIELPLLPIEQCLGDTYDSASMHDYARAAVLADRERRAEYAQPAKPTVHSARWELCGDGFARRIMLDARTSITNATLCWTDGGRVWIDSEKNRVLAQKLRANGYLQAADALDGGER